MGDTTRRCPRDGVALAAVALATGEGATVDTCGDCGGFFLDKNELLRLTGDRRLNSVLRDEAGVQPAAIGCPACGTSMVREIVRVRDTEPDAIEALPVDGGRVAVDVCPGCFGLWLDRGELDILRARINRAPVEREGDGPRAVAVARQVRVTQARAAGRRFVWLDEAVHELARRYR